MKCESCGAENASGMSKCGSCGAVLPKDEASSSRDAVRSIWNAPRSSRISDDSELAGAVEKSLFSIAVNVRRIFIVMLTFLVISAISLILTLLMSVSHDPSSYENMVMIAASLASLIAIAGTYYAVVSKRLSDK